jgi:2-methylcitrate dehydratase
MLAAGIVAEDEQDRFLSAIARLPALSATELQGLNFAVPADRLTRPAASGIFDWSNR